MISINNGITQLKNTISQSAKKPGVYRFYGDEENTLYVGKAKVIPNRLSNYTNIEALPNRLRMMVAQISRIEVIYTENETQALMLEAELIKSLQPRYNIRLKDGKSYPYIAISTGHEYPRIYKHRGKREKGNTYFGPFASSDMAEKTITELQKVFKVRPCTDSFFASRQRPCIQYQIKRCSAPCVGKISPKDYAYLVECTAKSLRGQYNELKKNLVEAMEQASQAMNYELAATYRDRIKAISYVQSHSSFHLDGDKNIDMVGIKRQGDTILIQLFLIRHGINYGKREYFFEQSLDLSETLEQFLALHYMEQSVPEQIICNHNISSEILTMLKAQCGHKVEAIIPNKRPKHQHLHNFLESNLTTALEQYLSKNKKVEEIYQSLAQLFGLKDVPERIEVIDNSHSFGKHAVGCIIVASKEGFLKNGYRKYNITSVDKGDDYAMLREVLTRRIKSLTSNNRPDLFLIDGGKGHLSAAKEIFEKFNITIPFVCISKGPDRNAGREFFHKEGVQSFQLPENDKSLHYLQKIRDEVHRFAITSYRGKHRKSLTKSSLDDIPGIGQKRKKLLLQHFGSPDGVREASVEMIAKIPGIDKKIAQIIHSYLHSELNS
jgi:excinuclease ABC subunit C